MDGCLADLLARGACSVTIWHHRGGIDCSQQLITPPCFTHNGTSGVGRILLSHGVVPVTVVPVPRKAAWSCRVYAGLSSLLRMVWK